ncbi:MAG: UDP-glucose 4-epimerase GalE [Armatimonadetes bacterium]|nr:UDP-glucose 4-epimerase GalE [Armatimonadota bacterium]
MILVIGGAGFIGSHMAKRLRQQGEPHLIFDNFEAGHRAAILDSKVVEGDIRDPEALRKVFALHDIDVVMHFAAYIAVGESGHKPLEYWENNTGGMINLLKAMRVAGVSKVVFSSTAAIFGEPEYTPIDEAHPKHPTSVYGETKHAVEQILAKMEEANGIRSVCLRYFNAAGADPEGEIGEDHEPESHLIPAAILAGMGKTPGLTIFGTNYPTRDGTCVRDYIHVYDLAKAHLAAVSHLRAGGSSRAYNLGNGAGYTVREVIESVKNVTGLPIQIEEGPRREGDPAVLVASSEKIRQELGWEPQYGALDTMVEHAWAWRKANPDGYRD